MWTWTSGCSSVIQYSRNLIWAQSIFFILNVWCWFSYGMLINSNDVWIWGIIQICKIFVRMFKFNFYSRCVSVFQQWREVLGAHGLSGHSVKRQIPILWTVSPVSQNLYGKSLNPFQIFLARKYTSFGHSAYCQNIYKNLSHLRAKYGKSPSIFCRFSLRGNSNFHWMFWFGPFISAFLWYVLCIGILLCWQANDVMFWGCHSHFGTQKNHASTTSEMRQVAIHKGASHLWRSCSHNRPKINIKYRCL